MAEPGRKKGIVDDWTLYTWIKKMADGLTPRTARSLQLEKLYPRPLVQNMTAVLKRDLREALKCFAAGLWTATPLMCFRILERETKRYLRAQYGAPEANSLAEVIQQFRRHTTNETFLKNLERMKELRNKAMHGDARLSPTEATKLLRTTLVIVSWTSNIAT